MFRAVHLLSFVFIVGRCTAQYSTPANQSKSEPCPARHYVRLLGLTSPAVVSNSIFVHADEISPGATVDFYIDDKVVDREDRPPYWLGGVDGKGEPKGFRIESAGLGKHRLYADVSSGDHKCSDVIEIEVIRSNNSTFSSTLTPYKHQPAERPLEVISPEDKQSALSSVEATVRGEVLSMYQNWGINPFMDSEADRSKVLRSLTPQKWAPPQVGSNRPWSMMFSPDAVFYHRIPQEWPRVSLPRGYFQSLQLNTAHGGDGIGFGVVVGNAQSPSMIVRSQWYNVQSTLEEISFRIPSDWKTKLPTTEAGDRHVIFIDPSKCSFVSAYKTSTRPENGAPAALYAAGPTSFDSLGDSGGSIAANFAELPLLIQPGESTDPVHPIRHAIGGPVRRVWAARVYPATAWDAGIKSAKDSCSGRGSMNTGLIPYGGVIQLDPGLDLGTLNLSLPALRILQAMQTYGYYVMDYGCADIDIYTALDDKELEPYGGLWGSPRGPGVQNEIQKVLKASTLYVVAPLIKQE